jgi:hypothetical protein
MQVRQYAIGDCEEGGTGNEAAECGNPSAHTGCFGHFDGGREK